MTLSHIITTAEFQELDNLTRASGTIWLFQNKVKQRILNAINIIDEEFEIWPNNYTVVIEQWIVWLKNMTTGRFHPNDNVDIVVQGNEILDFMWEKMVNVEVNGNETYFVLDNNSFFMPLNI